MSNAARLILRLAVVDAKDDTEFAPLVSDSIEELHLDNKDVAKEFGVALSTVDRWKLGTSRPHPSIRKRVYEYLHKSLTERTNALRHECLATLVGYNELAKSAPTLGEKVYNRLALGHVRDRYIKLGGKMEMKSDTGDFVLVLDGETRPHINFKEADIELMRDVVKKWDEEHPKP